MQVYWWYVIVPQERTRLGRSKRMGDVKEYLEELEGDKGRRLERWFYSDWLQQRAKRRQQRAQASAAAEAPTANQAAEGQQGSYGAQSSQAADAPSRRAEEGSSAPSPAPQSKQSLLRPPSDATPTPRFASMDNPLVAAAALLALMATLATAGRALSNLVEGA